MVEGLLVAELLADIDLSLTCCLTLLTIDIKSEIQHSRKTNKLQKNVLSEWVPN